MLDIVNNYALAKALLWLSFKQATNFENEKGYRHPFQEGHRAIEDGSSSQVDDHLEPLFILKNDYSSAEAYCI